MEIVTRTLAWSLLAAGTLLAMSTGSAWAVPVVYATALSGAAENPSNASPATGYSVVTLDTDLETLRVQVTFAGLTGPTSDAHIHCCIAPPGNVGVAVPGAGALTGFPLGVFSGSYDGTFGLLDAATYRPNFITNNGGTVAGARAALIAGIENGLAYVNVHTTVFPGGEIRGFLTEVPAPASAAALCAALLGLVALRRRAA